MLRRRSGAGVDHGRYLDIVPQQIRSRAPSVVVVREDRDLHSRRDAVPVYVRPDGARKHHAGPVVVAERYRPFCRARAEHRAFRIHPPKNLARFSGGFVQVVGRALQCSENSMVE